MAFQRHQYRRGAKLHLYPDGHQPECAGNYDVVVANVAGSVTSSVAKLTVGMALNNPSFEADTFTV